MSQEEKYRKQNIFKSVSMIDHVTGWFKITQYYDIRDISIMNLVKTTWLTRYPRPMEIMYDLGSEFISHKLIKNLIET